MALIRVISTDQRSANEGGNLGATSFNDLLFAFADGRPCNFTFTLDKDEVLRSMRGTGYKHWGEIYHISRYGENRIGSFTLVDDSVTSLIVKYFTSSNFWNLMPGDKLRYILKHANLDEHIEVIMEDLTVSVERLNIKWDLQYCNIQRPLREYLNRQSVPANDVTLRYLKSFLQNDADHAKLPVGINQLVRATMDRLVTGVPDRVYYFKFGVGSQVGDYLRNELSKGIEAAINAVALDTLSLKLGAFGGATLSGNGGWQMRIMNDTEISQILQPGKIFNIDQPNGYYYILHPSGVLEEIRR